MSDYIWWKNQGLTWQEEERKRRLQRLSGYGRNRVFDRDNKEITGQYQQPAIRRHEQQTWSNFEKNQAVSNATGNIPKFPKYQEDLPLSSRLTPDTELEFPEDIEHEIKKQQESISNIVRPDFAWRLWESGRFLRRGNLAAAAHILDPEGNVIGREAEYDENGEFVGYKPIGGHPLVAPAAFLISRGALLSPAYALPMAVLAAIRIKEKHKEREQREDRSQTELEADKWTPKSEKEFFKFADPVNEATRWALRNMGWMRKFGDKGQAEELLELKRYEKENPGQAKTYNNVTRRSFLQIQYAAIGQEMLSSNGRPSSELVERAKKIREEIEQLNDVIPEFGLEAVNRGDVRLLEAVKYFWAEQGPVYTSALATMAAVASGDAVIFQKGNEDIARLGTDLTRLLTGAGLGFKPLLTMTVGGSAAIGAQTAGSTYADLMLEQIRVPIFADDRNRFGVSQGGQATIKYPGAETYHRFDKSEGEIIQGRRVIGYATQEMPIWIARRAAIASGFNEAIIEAISLRNPFIKNAGLIPVMKKTIQAVTSNPLYKAGTRNVLVRGAGRWVREGALQTGEEVMQELGNHWIKVWAEETSNALRGTQYQRYEGEVQQIIKETIDKAVIGSLALALPGQGIVTVADYKRRSAIMGMVGRKEFEDLLAGQDLDEITIQELFQRRAASLGGDIDIALTAGQQSIIKRLSQGLEGNQSISEDRLNQEKQKIKERVLKGEITKKESVELTGSETLYDLSQKAQEFITAQSYVKTVDEDIKVRKKKSTETDEEIALAHLETVGVDFDRVSVAAEEASQGHRDAREIQILQTSAKIWQERIDNLDRLLETETDATTIREINRQKSEAQLNITDEKARIDELFKTIKKGEDVVVYEARGNERAGEIHLVRHINDDQSISWEVRNVRLGEIKNTDVFGTIREALQSIYTNTPVPSLLGGMYTAGGIANTTDRTIKGVDKATPTGRVERIITTDPAMRGSLLNREEDTVRSFISKLIDKHGIGKENIEGILTSIQTKIKKEGYGEIIGKDLGAIEQAVRKEIAQRKRNIDRGVRRAERILKSIRDRSPELKAELEPYQRYLEAFATIKKLSEGKQENIEELQNINTEIQELLSNKGFKYLLSKTLLDETESRIDLAMTLAKMERETVGLEKSLLKNLTEEQKKLQPNKRGRSAERQLLKKLQKGQWFSVEQKSIISFLQAMDKIATREMKLAKKASAWYKKDKVLDGVEAEVKEASDQVRNLLERIDTARSKQVWFLTAAIDSFTNSLDDIQSSWIEKSGKAVLNQDGQFRKAIAGVEKLLEVKVGAGFEGLLSDISVANLQLASDGLIRIAMHELHGRVYRGLDNKYELLASLVGDTVKDIQGNRAEEGDSFSREKKSRMKNIKETLIGVSSSLYPALLLIESIVPKGSMARQVLFFGKGAANVQLKRAVAGRQIRSRLEAHGIVLNNKEAEEYLNEQSGTVTVTKFTTKGKSEVMLTKGELISLAVHLTSQDNTRHLVYKDQEEGTTGGFSLRGDTEGIIPEDVLVIDEGELRTDDPDTPEPTPGKDVQQENVRTDEATGLPLNPDETVTVYHHTNKEAVDRIIKSGELKSRAEPDVYVTTRSITDTGYGDTAVAIRVEPSRLIIDDEFPSGRRDFRLQVGKPGGSIQVDLEPAPGESVEVYEKKHKAWVKRQTEKQREEVLRALVNDNLTAKDLQFVEAVREFYQWQYKELNRIFRERTGVDLTYIDNYIGMSTVKSQRGEGDVIVDTADLDSLSQTFLAKVADGTVFLPEGALQERTKASGAIYLDNIARVLNHAIQETAVYTSLAHQMTDAVRLLNEPKVKQALMVKNRKYYTLLNKYLSDVVAEQMAHEWWDKAVRFMRKNASRAFLGLNWGVSLSQALSAAVVSGMVNEKYMLQATTQLWGEEGKAWEQLLVATSGIIAERLEGRFDPDAALSLGAQKDVAVLTGKLKRPILDKALFGVRLVDKHTVKSIMIASILQVMDQTRSVDTYRKLPLEQRQELEQNVGLDEQAIIRMIERDSTLQVELIDLAVRYAESVVWRSQPMFNAAHRSDLSRRGSEAIRTMTAFRGWQDALFGLVGRNILSFARNEQGAGEQLLRSLMGSIFVGGLGMWTILSLRTHLRNLITGDEREPDPLWSKFFDVSFSAVPFVRELYNAFSFWLKSGSGSPQFVGTGLATQSLRDFSDMFYHIKRAMESEGEAQDYHSWEAFYQAFKTAMIGGGLPYVFTYPVKGIIQRGRE